MALNQVLPSAAAATAGEQIGIEESFMQMMLAARQAQAESAEVQGDSVLAAGLAQKAATDEQANSSLDQAAMSFGTGGATIGGAAAGFGLENKTNSDELKAANENLGNSEEWNKLLNGGTEADAVAGFSSAAEAQAAPSMNSVQMFDKNGNITKPTDADTAAIQNARGVDSYSEPLTKARTDLNKAQEKWQKQSEQYFSKQQRYGQYARDFSQAAGQLNQGSQNICQANNQYAQAQDQLTQSQMQFSADAQGNFTQTEGQAVQNLASTIQQVEQNRAVEYQANKA